MCRLYKALLLVLFLIAPLAPGMARAQDMEDAPPQMMSYAPQELQQLVAPVALYPDQLLGQVLMAAAYPLEVVEAQRWLTSNPGLSGDALTDALESQNWDPSVKALTAFPQVLSMMDGNLEWTEKLGEAFMSDEAGVMDAVQQLRGRAQEANRLPPPDQMLVSSNNGYITIAPTQPNSVYVPWYNPTVVFAPWPYPGYAPYYFPAPYSSYCYYGACWYSFAPPVTVYYSWWGWDRISWRNHCVHIDTHRWRALSTNRPAPAGNVWHYDPAHRHGVPYVNPAVRQRFQATSTATVRENRGFVTGATGRFTTAPRRTETGGTAFSRPSWQEQTGGHRPTPPSKISPRPEFTPQEDMQSQQHFLSVTPSPQQHHHQRHDEGDMQNSQPTPQVEQTPIQTEAPQTNTMRGNHGGHGWDMPQDEPRVQPQRSSPPLFETMPPGNESHGQNRGGFSMHDHEHGSHTPQVHVPVPAPAPVPAPSPAAPQNFSHDGGDHHGH